MGNDNNRLSPLGCIIGLIFWVLAFLSQCGRVKTQKDYDELTPHTYKTKPKEENIYKISFSKHNKSNKQQIKNYGKKDI